MNNKKRGYDDVNRDLSSILNTYPSINFTNLEFFIPVYYPIALVELDTIEESFEDFEMIELAVLKLINLGCSNASEISKLLAIDEKYVLRMMKLLTGYGHLQDGYVTEIGRRSLVEERKIEKKAGKQLFQVNALNGTIMKLEDVISERQLIDKEYTRFRVSHIMNMDGVQTQDLMEQLTGEGYYQNFVESGKNEVVNLVGIQDIRFKEIQYAYSYLLKLKGSFPMVFSKRYNRNKRKMEEKLKWVPLSVSNPKIISELNLSDTVPVMTKLEEQMIEKTIGLLNVKLQGISLEEMRQTYMDALDSLYPFDFSHCKFVQSKNGCNFLVNEQAFSSYGKSLLPILTYMGRFQKYMFTRDMFYGTIVNIRSDSSFLDELCKKLIQKMDEYGEKRVRNILNNKSLDFDGKNVIYEINQVLDHLENEDWRNAEQ